MFGMSKGEKEAIESLRSTVKLMNHYAKNLKNTYNRYMELEKILGEAKDALVECLKNGLSPVTAGRVLRVIDDINKAVSIRPIDFNEEA